MENINEAAYQSFLEAMVHPVSARLFMEVSLRKEATAGDLALALPDIPQATLYRHLNTMAEKGLLKIVAQRKKRALYEKVYAVSLAFGEGIGELLKQNRGDVYAAMFFQFMMTFYGEFQAYASRPGIDIANDGSGFSMGPIFATNEELKQTMMEIGALIEKLRSNAPTTGSGRRMHTIGLIISPPGDNEK